MKAVPTIAVLCGAISPEREVSLRSGHACAQALAARFSTARVTLHELDANALPAQLEPERHVIFPVIHGDYGEDGAIQAELESRGFAFAGSDSAASRLCINKVATKARLRECGAPVCGELAFDAKTLPDADELVRELGASDVVIKPADKGSSVGLHFASGANEIATTLAGLGEGSWMAEPRLRGREMTVGVLDGAAMGIVEIVPKQGSGNYDFANKYTAGATEYRFPAALPDLLRESVCRCAEKAFAACGCRDFARLDVILREDGGFFFLEINTMPGLTATSLLPKSASCVGLDFETLCERMIAPALRRFGRAA